MPSLRVQMRVELSKLHNEIGATMIYVTHDQVEAMTMADKIVVLRDGLSSRSAPRSISTLTGNRFVAGFIGSPQMNFLKAQVVEQRQGEARVTVPDAPDHLLADPAARGCVRHVRDRRSPSASGPSTSLGTPGGPGLEVSIDVVENLGGIAFAYGRTNASQDVIHKAESETPPQSGMSVTASIKDANIATFSMATARRSVRQRCAVRMQEAAA
jgi:ABC-type sugar transport system ATPase subunit